MYGGNAFRKCKQNDPNVVLENNRMCMETKRVCESKAETKLRNEADKLLKKTIRLFETDDEALIRKNINKLSMKCVRLFETDHEALCRKEMNKLSMTTTTLLKAPPFTINFKNDIIHSITCPTHGN